ncbi:MAG: DUF4143 domain-containing protein, partial [Puniceicoccales bacterium]|nr:DUF4143 domain-containing protein [Puniceicoccales bacterium]
LRDTGLLHHLLNLNTLDEVLTHPIAGASWETFVLENIQRSLKIDDPFASAYFWRTSDGHEADLLIERGGKADTLLEVKIGSGADIGAAKQLAAIAVQLGANRAAILSRQDGTERLLPNIERLGPAQFLTGKW